jgi:1,2-phenylacetyl-CoA epoxidase catalytic subunit
MIYEINEKQQRIRYIRVLEKFFTRTISLLKLDNFDKDLFIARVKKNHEEMLKTKEIDLYSEYYTELKVFINRTMFYAEEHSKSFEEERANLLKDANLLQKEKNRGSYKKDKHKKQDFGDGY